MNIQDILGTGNQITQNTKGQGKQELGQEDFMKLLVAQMQNQDPSNPADNSQFLSQIAQFKMVDGIDGLGESFDGIAGNFFTNQAMSAAQLVGREVLTDSNYGWFEAGKSLDGVIEIPEFTEALNIQVRDSHGKLLKTIDKGDFSDGALHFSWNGLNEQDEAQGSGDYVVTATALVDGSNKALPVQLFNTVESITLNRTGNNVQLQLNNNESVNFSGVSQYR